VPAARYYECFVYDDDSGMQARRDPAAQAQEPGATQDVAQTSVMQTSVTPVARKRLKSWRTMTAT